MVRPDGGALVNSLDTNILYFATNSSCPEHPRARALLERAAHDSLEWMIADQVLFEYYRLVRNPAVLEKPLSATDAGRRLRFFRDEIGWRHCAYDRDCWSDAIPGLSDPSFPARRTFDLVLAVTLRRNGVDTFYTRNPADFDAFGWFTVIDPLA
jgi:predicted nucleic acid-binding protein